MTLSRTPLRRGAAPKKRTPIKKRNPKRRQSEFARCYHSKERVLFVKSLPCAWCAKLRLPIQCGATENAHTEGGGAGRKAHYTTIAPLGRYHHERYDQHQPPFDVDSTRRALKMDAILTEEAWLASQQQERE